MAELCLSSTAPLWRRRTSLVSRARMLQRRTWHHLLFQRRAHPSCSRSPESPTACHGSAWDFFSCVRSSLVASPGAALRWFRGLLEGRAGRRIRAERVKSSLQQAADETAEELCASTIEGVQHFMPRQRCDCPGIGADGNAKRPRPELLGRLHLLPLFMEAGVPPGWTARRRPPFCVFSGANSSAVTQTVRYQLESLAGESSASAMRGAPLPFHPAASAPVIPWASRVIRSCPAPALPV